MNSLTIKPSGDYAASLNKTRYRQGLIIAFMLLLLSIAGVIVYLVFAKSDTDAVSAEATIIESAIMEATTIDAIADNAIASMASQWGGIKKQNVSHAVAASNNHQWRSAFSIEANTQRVLIGVTIKLIPIDSISRSALNAQKQRWLTRIQQIWNQQFLLEFSDRSTLPIEIEPRFSVAKPHHEVIIREQQPQPNQNNWALGTHPTVIAHEVGHMLGAYDEYQYGATTSSRFIDKNSLMGENTRDGYVLPRHMNVVLATIKTLSADNDIRIISSVHHDKKAIVSDQYTQIAIGSAE